MHIKRKLGYVTVMGPLSMIATLGMVWQYNRWNESKKRWGTIDKELDNFDPCFLDGGKSLPWNDPNDSEKEEYLGWQYKLLKVNGKIDTNRDNWFKVRRVSDARMGNLVLVPFYMREEESSEDTIISKNIFVNLGWIPEDIDHKSLIVEEGKDINITGLVKKSEADDVKKTSVYYPDSENSYGLVDLKRFVKIKENMIGKSIDQIYYIERVLKSDDFAEHLYPVATRPDNFKRPWLTPSRHLEYS